MGRYTDMQRVAAKVDSPPRYLDTGSGGKLLRPENQIAYDAAPAPGIVRDTLISAGFMQPARSDEITLRIDSEFSNDVYAINGASKVLADLWAAPLQGNSSFVADVGWQIDLGAGTSASDTMPCSADLFAAIPGGPACSGVFVIDPSNTADFCQLDFRDADNNNIQFGLRGGDVIRIFSPTLDVVSPTPIVPGPIKIGFTLTPTRVAICVNGDVVVDGVPDAYATQFTTCTLFGGLYSGAGATLSVPSLKFYSPMTDAQLQALTA